MYVIHVYEFPYTWKKYETIRIYFIPKVNCNMTTKNKISYIEWKVDPKGNGKFFLSLSDVPSEYFSA